MFVWAFKSPLKCPHHKYLMDNLLLIVSSVLLLACKDKWISTSLLPPAPHIHSLPAPSPEQPAECYLFILWISPTHINCHSNINSRDKSHYHEKFNPSFVRACKWAVLLLKIQFLWSQLQLAYVSDNGDSRKRDIFLPPTHCQWFEKLPCQLCLCWWPVLQKPGKLREAPSSQMMDRW